MLNQLEVNRLSRAKVWLIAGVSALLMSVMLVLSSADTASATPKNFCYGVTLGGKGGGGGLYYCNSLYSPAPTFGSGFITEVGGSGAQHSVCVLAWYNNGTTMCSAGPNQGVYNFTPSGANGDVAEIYNNAAGTNTAYGFADVCASPCP